MNKLPAQSYIRRGTKVSPMVVRISMDLKDQSEQAAQHFQTSMNRFVEAALTWYLDTLESENKDFKKTLK